MVSATKSAVAYHGHYYSIVSYISATNLTVVSATNLQYGQLRTCT